MRIPSATYRVQFNRGFTFEDARKLVNYLDDLGITDLYASPIFTALPESNHGYDVCDYNEINPVLGGNAGWQALTGELRKRGMGLLLDFVPNHMGTVPTLNQWWRDILERGQQSQYAKFFDVDWMVFDGRILLPILEDELAKVLERGLFHLASQEGRLKIQYRETVLPLTPTSEPQAWDFLRAGKNSDRDELITTFNSKTREPEQRQWMGELLEKQIYQLEYWRTGTRRANYRRFFEIDGLIGININSPEVFEAAHRLLGELVKNGEVTGIRLDHIDGLADPAGYLKTLQRFLREKSRETDQFYLLVEKILMDDEELRADWPVAGTTGYEFGAAVIGVLMDSAAKENFSEIYEDFVGDKTTLEEVIVRSKQQVMRMALSKEVGILARLLKECTGDDSEVDELRAAVEAVLIYFPVYRTYMTPGTPVNQTDLAVVETALKQARKHSPNVKAKTFECLRKLLVGDDVADLDESRKLFRQRFQQFSGPIMAKSFEDTTFFVFNRLIALNEVGGDPGRFGWEPAAFHAMNARRLQRESHTMLTTSTHDTKLSEDARARMAAISELSGQWKDFLETAANTNEAFKMQLEGKSAPDRNEEYLCYQILLASRPLEKLDTEEQKKYTERVQGHMLKALREAKINTRWDEQNKEWEAATSSFVQRFINEPPAEFVAKFEPLAESVAELGAINSLTQTLLKLTSPGVPDIFQGNECWEFALTDPDNRKPVDFGSRRRLLRSLEAQRPAELLKNWKSGAIKLFLTRTVLNFRRQHPRLFQEGDYVPLNFAGKFAENCLGFVRRCGDEVAVSIVPRLTARVGQPPVGKCWGSTTVDLAELDGTTLRDLFTGNTIQGKDAALSQIFAELPFAILTNNETSGS